MVIYLPAAIFAICSGFASSLHCDRDLAASNFFLDPLVMEDELAMVWTYSDLRLLKEQLFQTVTFAFLDAQPQLLQTEDHDQAICYELYACAPEVLAKINIGSGSKVSFLFWFFFANNFSALIPQKKFHMGFVVNLRQATITMCLTSKNQSHVEMRPIWCSGMVYCYLLLEWGRNALDCELSDAIF